MAEPHSVTLVHEVEVRIDVEDVEFAPSLIGLDAGNIDGMVASDNDRQRPSVKDSRDALTNVGVALYRVGMHDVGVADIDHADVRPEIDAVVLVVVGAGMAE